MSGVPSPKDVTFEQIKEFLALYPKVIEQHYQVRIKDEKKRNDALVRDGWRYEELPGSLVSARGKSGSEALSLEMLERLVQWKITHGPSRPFLPAMIRKNSAASVTECTSSAAGILKSSREAGKPNLKAIFNATQKALDAVSALSGVGPATASLVLAVHSPEDIPFFEDEMFQWLCSDTWQQKGGKLKYDKKEYEQLFRQLWELREKLGIEKVQAVDIEKASFVMMRDFPAVNDLPPVSNMEKKSASKTKAKQEKIVNDKNKRSTAKSEADTGKTDEEEASTRRSKRVKR